MPVEYLINKARERVPVGESGWDRREMLDGETRFKLFRGSERERSGMWRKREREREGKRECEKERKAMCLSKHAQE